MDIWDIFLKIVAVLIAVGIFYLMVRPREPEVITWHKDGRRLDFTGNGNTGMVRYLDLNNNPKEYFYWSTYHVADPDSMIRAFKWLNGEEVEL